MVDMQLTPDSALSPTYTTLYRHPAGRYDFDVAQSACLDQFYYSAGTPSSGLLPVDGSQVPVDSVDHGLSVYPAAVAVGHHRAGPTKRPRYSTAAAAAVDDVVTTGSFSRPDSRRQSACQQPVQSWSVAASHGMQTNVRLYHSRGCKLISQSINQSVFCCIRLR